MNILRGAILSILMTTGALVLSVGVAEASADNIKPCKFEDSNSCVWQANKVGDGYGHSFIAGPNGGHKNITHAHAAHLLSF